MQFLHTNRASHQKKPSKLAHFVTKSAIDSVPTKWIPANVNSKNTVKCKAYTMK